MKKIVVTMVFLAAGLGFGAFGNSSRMVYVCTGPTAYAYHIDRNCRGLSRCSGEIRCVSYADALSMGRTKACGWCTN